MRRAGLLSLEAKDINAPPRMAGMQHDRSQAQR